MAWSLIRSIFLVLLINSALFWSHSVMAQPQCTWNGAKLLPSDGASVDKTGTSVSLSGDWAILGSPYDDDRTSNAGAAYFYRWNGSSWVHFQKIYAADAGADDRFGHAVGVSGNVAIIGAFYDDDRGSNSGSAYIFRYNGSSWVQEQKLLAADGAAGDSFGFAVGLSGSNAIVGAYGDDDKGVNSGAAYIFQFNGSAWSSGAKIAASDGAAADYFGLSVAISGQYAVVGADLDDSIAANAGSAYIFRLGTSGWVQDTKLVPSNILADDHFGISVAIDGEVVVVGADESDAAAPSGGAAFVFRLVGSEWQSQGRLLPSGTPAYESFGVSVAVSGDRIVVGAANAKDNSLTYPNPDQGAAYVFDYSNGAWNLSTRILAEDGWAYDLFGAAVAASGQRILVGAPGKASNGTDAGAAYVYEDTCQAGNPVISARVPPDGYVDPLEDRDATTGAVLGLRQVSITFSEPVRSLAGGSLTLANFNVQYFRNGASVSASSADLQSGGVSVSLVSGSGAGPYVLQFAPRIPLGAWTKIAAINVFNSAGAPISTQDNKIVLGNLPMDIDQNGIVSGADINRWLQIFNDLFDPAPLSKVQLLDQKRDGAIYNNDITRALQLINGIGTFQGWSGYSIGPKP